MEPKKALGRFHQGQQQPFIFRGWLEESDRRIDNGTSAARFRLWGATYARDFKAHSSAPSDFFAPSARSNRSVVARSAAIPFSSWVVDRTPARGSVSIARSFFFFRQSKNVLNIASSRISAPPGIL